MDPIRAAAAGTARDRLADGLLAWLTANIDAFDPPQEDAILDATPEHVMPGPRRKAFGELGLALYLVQRVPRLRERPDARRLTQAWLTMARSRNIFFDARRRVHLVPLLAVALTALDALGEGDEAARRALQTVLDRRFLDRTERSAWGQIDIAYYLDAIGLRHGFPGPATLFRRSSLRALPALPHALRIDVYAATHLIFHLSDFGARAMAGATRPELDRIHSWLALALATCMAEQDWDLTGELVAARSCLGQGEDALGEAALAALVEAQQPAGFVPDQSWLKGLPAAGSEAERADAEFLAVYHPTLVALIMLACEGAPRPAPEPGPVAEPAPARAMA